MTATNQQVRQELRVSPLVIVGRSEQARRMRSFANLAASTEHTLLIRGETGAGKDHMAEVIHSLNTDRKNLVPVDCGALTGSLSETELFGHTRGAFTDAQDVKDGLLQIAKHGTIFFNEVANMSLELQAKFLRILDKKSFRMVGGTQEHQINTRIIAATNADLEKAVEVGQFRADLYHRLNGITYTMPSLRERPDDVPSLVEHFLEVDKFPLKFSGDAITAMMEYRWPGNVRELRAVVMKASFTAMGREVKEMGVEFVKPHLTNPLGVQSDRLMTYEETKRDYFHRLITLANGNVTKAARLAHINRQTLAYNLRRYHLEEFTSDARRKGA